MNFVKINEDIMGIVYNQPTWDTSFFDLLSRVCDDEPVDGMLGVAHSRHL